MREEIDTGDKCTNEGHGSTGLQQIANNLTIIKLARTRKKKIRHLSRIFYLGRLLRYK